MQPLCVVVGVARSGYYAWRARKPSARAQADAELLPMIQEIHQASHATYGSPRIHAELQARGYRCGRKRVARLLHQTGLTGCPPRTPPQTTTPAASVATPDLLEREFSATAPNQKWVADITYIATDEGWVYLAVVEDLFSRMIVGWAMLPQITSDLVVLALQMALHQRQPPRDLIHHSDHGSQYTATALQTVFARYHIRPSLGTTGDCYDNAVAESFFQLLKRERIRRKTYPSREDARQDVFNYIEMFYNPVRRHSYNDDLSPVEFERRHFNKVGSV